MKETILAEFEMIRNRNIEFMDGLTDQSADQIPEGFRNNVRWHLGHIYTVHELYIFSNLKLETKIPENFKEWFGNGSSPEKWEGIPISLEELKNLLEDQKNRTIDVFSKMDLYKQLEEPIALGSRFTFNRISEIIAFMLYHEGNHNGFMKALRKLAE